MSGKTKPCIFLTFLIATSSSSLLLLLFLFLLLLLLLVVGRQGQSLVPRLSLWYYLNNLYLLLAECVVRTVRYGPSFFPRLMTQARSARAIKREKKNRGSITYGTDEANEFNKMFIIWLYINVQNGWSVTFAVRTVSTINRSELTYCQT